MDEIDIFTDRVGVLSGRFAEVTWDTTAALVDFEESLRRADIEDLTPEQKLGIRSGGAIDLFSKAQAGREKFERADRERADLEKILERRNLVVGGQRTETDLKDLGLGPEEEAKMAEAMARRLVLEKSANEAREASNNALQKALEQEAQIRQDMIAVSGRRVDDLLKSGDISGIRNVAGIGLDQKEDIANVKTLISASFAERRRGVKDDDVLKNLREQEAASLDKLVPSLNKYAAEQLLAAKKVQRTSIIQELALIENKRAIDNVTNSMKALNAFVLGASRSAEILNRLDDELAATQGKATGPIKIDTRAFSIPLEELDMDTFNKSLRDGMLAMTPTGLAAPLQKAAEDHVQQMADQLKTAKFLIGNLDTFKIGDGVTDLLGHELDKVGEKAVDETQIQEIYGAIIGQIDKTKFKTEGLTDTIQKLINEAFKDGKFDEADLTDINAALNDHVKGIREVQKAYIDEINRFSDGMHKLNQAVAEATAKFNEASATVVEVEERGLDRIAEYTGQERNRDEIERGRIRAANARLGVARTGFGARAGDVAATAGAARRSKATLDRLQGGPQPTDPNQIKRHTEEIRQASEAYKNANAELKRMTDQSARASDAMKKAGDLTDSLDKLKAAFDQTKSFLQEFAFGTVESREETVKAFRDLQLAMGQGSMRGATGEQRGRIGGLLDQLSDVRFATGETGAQMKGRFATQELIDLGFDPQFAAQAGAEFGKGPIEKRMLKQLEEINAQEKAAAQALADLAKAEEEATNDLANQLGDKFTDDLSTAIGGAVEGALKKDPGGQQAQREADLITKLGELNGTIPLVNTELEGYTSKIEGYTATLEKLIAALPGVREEAVEKAERGKFVRKVDNQEGNAEWLERILFPKMYEKAGATPASVEKPPWADPKNIDAWQKYNKQQQTLQQQQNDAIKKQTENVENLNKALIELIDQMPPSKAKGKARGGRIGYFNRGGKVEENALMAALGMVPKGTDTIPAMLTPGEFVINAKAAKKIGYGRLNQMNYMKDGGMGMIKPSTSTVEDFIEGGWTPEEIGKDPIIQGILKAGKETAKNTKKPTEPSFWKGIVGGTGGHVGLAGKPAGGPESGRSRLYYLKHNMQNDPGRLGQQAQYSINKQNQRDGGRFFGGGSMAAQWMAQTGTRIGGMGGGMGRGGLNVPFHTKEGGGPLLTPRQKADRKTDALLKQLGDYSLQQVKLLNQQGYLTKEQTDMLRKAGQITSEGTFSLKDPLTKKMFQQFGVDPKTAQGMSPEFVAALIKGGGLGGQSRQNLFDPKSLSPLADPLNQQVATSNQMRDLLVDLIRCTCGETELTKSILAEQKKIAMQGSADSFKSAWDSVKSGFKSLFDSVFGKKDAEEQKENKRNRSAKGLGGMRGARHVLRAQYGLGTGSRDSRAVRARKLGKPVPSYLRYPGGHGGRQGMWMPGEGGGGGGSRGTGRGTSPAAGGTGGMGFLDHIKNAFGFFKDGILSLPFPGGDGTAGSGPEQTQDSILGVLVDMRTLLAKLVACTCGADAMTSGILAPPSTTTPATRSKPPIGPLETNVTIDPDFPQSIPVPVKPPKPPQRKVPKPRDTHTGPLMFDIPDAEAVEAAKQKEQKMEADRKRTQEYLDNFNKLATEEYKAEADAKAQAEVTARANPPQDVLDQRNQGIQKDIRNRGPDGIYGSPGSQASRLAEWLGGGATDMPIQPGETAAATEQARASFVESERKKGNLGDTHYDQFIDPWGMIRVPPNASQMDNKTRKLPHESRAIKERMEALPSDPSTARGGYGLDGDLSYSTQDLKNATIATVAATELKPNMVGPGPQDRPQPKAMDPSLMTDGVYDPAKDLSGSEVILAKAKQAYEAATKDAEGKEIKASEMSKDERSEVSRSAKRLSSSHEGG